jgi:hypothetical protein
MVNHMRTVLLNVTADMAPDDVYISPTFRPIIVPRYLQRIYNVILSPQMPAAPRAARINTFMRLLHVADYEPFTLLPDRRLTYDPTDQSAFFDSVADPSATIDFERLFNLVRSEATTLDSTNEGLFRPVSNYPPTLMENLRDLWNNDLAAIGRLTAGILALGYQFDDLNSG